MGIEREGCCSGAELAGVELVALEQVEQVAAVTVVVV